jgi:hypothetical protein
MKFILRPEVLIPIIFLLLQLILFISGAIMILRKLKLLIYPISGVEYSQGIFSSSILFAVLLVGSSSIDGTLQAYRTYLAEGVPVFSPLMNKCAQFFLILIFFELLLGALVTITARLFQSFGKGITEIREGNIPMALLVSVMVLGFGFSLRVIAIGIVQWSVPTYINIS